MKQTALFILVGPDAVCNRALQEHGSSYQKIALLKKNTSRVCFEGATEHCFGDRLEPGDEVLLDALRAAARGEVIMVCGDKFWHESILQAVESANQSDAPFDIKLYFTKKGLVPLSEFIPPLEAKEYSDRLAKRINELAWYHTIRFTNGFQTPGKQWQDLWNNIRNTRLHVDYTGKKVLDIATFNGLFAFEAEALGAQQVVGADTYLSYYKNFLLVKEMLGSEVLPYFNVSPYNIVERLDILKEECPGEEFGGFDIVQNFGLLYHLRDPMLCLSQARSVVNANGCMIVETGAIYDTENSHMAFNQILTPGKGYEGRYYSPLTNWWLPTIKCLFEMLRASLFEPVLETMHVLMQPGCGKDVCRVALVARAVPILDVNESFSKELLRVYRNPGLDMRLKPCRPDLDKC